MLKRLKQQGITILVSTSYMDEATLCDRIALIRNGQFLKIDTPRQIISQYDETLWTVASDRMSKLYTDLRTISGIKSCFSFGNTHHITVDTNMLSMSVLESSLTELSHTNIEIKPIEATIEDCFMAINK
jgi:ABC-type multidrug transport system ATPase subunit